MKPISSIVRILSVTIVLCFACALHGQTPQNPFPISGPMTITAPGYYRLTKNIISSATTGNIITINSHNVTIDFNNFFIIGPNNVASNLIGIYANEFGNLTVKNGSIAFCHLGIEFNGNGNPATTRNINHIIENMRITGIYGFGVYFPASSPGSVVSNCQFSQIGGSTSGTFTASVAIYGPPSDQTILVKDNIINKVTGPSGFPTDSYGIVYSFAVRNSIANSTFGVYAGKYQNNLTSNVTTPFSSGTDAGGNN
jgi:hypothetical protein